MLCSICFKEIPAVGTWTLGSNAAPVNNGRCCQTCDDNIVIPARITMMVNQVSTETYDAMLREQYDILRRQFEQPTTPQPVE